MSLHDKQSCPSGALPASAVMHRHAKPIDAARANAQRQVQGRCCVSGASIALGFLIALAIGLPTSTQAHGASAGDLKIEHPFATPTPPGVKVGAAYLRAVKNQGKVADKLLSASSPAAERVEIHRTTMDDGVMRMRQVPALEIPAGGEVKMRPGQAFHLMLLGLKQPLKVGDKFELQLTFEKAGKVMTTVVVQQPESSDGPEHAHHQ